MVGQAGCSGCLTGFLKYAQNLSCRIRSLRSKRGPFHIISLLPGQGKTQDLPFHHDLRRQRDRLGQDRQIRYRRQYLL